MKAGLCIATAIVILSMAAYSQDEIVKKPSALASDNAPAWLKDYQFEETQFTFVRIKYTCREVFGRNARYWKTDHPEADARLAALIQSKTTLATDHKVLELTSTDLKKHKLIYIVEPGSMRLSDGEVEALRGYLKNGGLLVLDDSFGEDQYENIRAELTRVFPTKKLKDLPIDHPIFHCVFNFSEKPQVPSERTGTLKEWTRRVGSVEFQCITDDNDQVVVLVCHNTDFNDGWANLGEDSQYAKEYSDKCAGPFGVNLVFYAIMKGRGTMRDR